MSGFNSGRTNTRGWLPAKLVMVGLACLSFALMGQAGCPLFPPPVVDTDGDGVADEDDNCPNTANADQADNDNDGLGNVCDPTPDGVTPPPSNDRDNDGIPNASDNCPDTANPDQADADNDGIGDVCDSTPTPPALTVDAGATQAATGGQTVVLTGLSGGGVPPVTFAWELVSGGTAGNVTLTNAGTQTASATFSSDASGTFTFRVTGTDSAGQTATDTTTVTATPSGSATSLTFTLNVDSLVGTSGDDLFTAPSVVTGLGALANTLQNGDSADGMGGDDTLNAFIVGNAGQTIAATLTDIGTINLTDFSADGGANTTLVGSNITGLNTFNLVNSTHGAAVAAADAFVITNLPSLLTNVGMEGTTQDLNVGFDAAATSASDDALTLNLTNVNTTVVANRPNITFTTAAANGLETLTVNSEGGTNRIRTLAQAGSASLATLNITGTTDLQIGDFVNAGGGAVGGLDNSILTINATSFTGDLLEVQGGNGNVTFNGGAGNDTIILSGTYTTADTIDGNDGTDLLGLTAAEAAAAANQTNVTDMEGLRVTNALNTAVTLSRWGSGITTVVLDAGANGGTLTYPGTLANAILEIGAFATNAAGAGALTVAVGNLGTADTLALTLNDADQAGVVTINGAETINLVSNLDLDGSAASGGANVFGNTFIATTTTGTGATVNVTGTEDLTFTGATSIGVLNAGTFTQALVMTAASTIQVQATGGSGNDQLRGSANSDTLVGNAGNDILSGEGAVDSITTGAGTDTVQIRVATANGVDRKLIADFTAGAGGDVLNVDADDLVTLTGTNNFADATSIQTHGTAGAVTPAAATELVLVTAATVTNLTDANSLNGTNLLTAIGGAINGQTGDPANDALLFAVADSTGNVGIYLGIDANDDDAIVAGELTLVAVLQNVTLGNLTFQNFTNVNGL
jgi:hypothetical protein